MHNRKPSIPKGSMEGLFFGPFRLTRSPLRLRRGRHEIKLQPRPLAVLLYLIEHAGVVVSQGELLQTVWNGTVVTPSALQVCIRAVRAALGDKIGAPRYIETVGREGYRFIAPLSTSPPAVRRQTSGVSQDKARTTPQQLRPESWQGTTSLVGRDAELARLHALLEKALTAERQLVFISGEAGIGKTALVDTFIRAIESWELAVDSLPQSQTTVPGLWIGRGQCLEHYGEGEAYLPVLEAVGQLCRGSGGSEVLATLRRYAPTWLLHLPSVVDPVEREALIRQGAGATQSQMLREIAEVLEAISVAQGLVLVLEDLHVSDPSTVELLAYLAQRRAPARLFLIGTYRPVEVVVQDHPLRGRVQELLARGSGQSITLELLTKMEVEAYVLKRLNSSALPLTLADQIWRRTDGNPLFVVNTVEYLLQQGWLIVDGEEWQLIGDLASSGVPETLQHLIAKQLDSLSSEQQQTLEVASVVGTIFTTASVAAGIQTTPTAIEEICEGLVRRGQFIKEQGLETWPDGTVSEQYEFRHVLYQEVLYQRLGTGRRARAHLAIGAREEAGYGTRADQRAVELAQHFRQGRNLPRAVEYLIRAGQNALRWSAYVEAVRHFSQGLTLLTGQPESPERRKQELWLQTGIVMAQAASKGFPLPEVEHALMRAHTLCSQIGDTPEIIPALVGLWNFYFTQAEIRVTRQLADQAFRLAKDVEDPALLGVVQAHLQATLYLQGELATAHVHGQEALAQFAVSPPPPLAFSYGTALESRTRNFAAVVLLALGYLDQARQQNRTALALARELGHVQTVAATLHVVAGFHGGCQEWQDMQVRAAELIELTTTQGLLFWWAQGTCNHGIALAQQGNTAEGISQIRQGLAVYRATGTTVGVTRILGWLAEACGRAGQIQEGLQVLDEAFTLVERNEELVWEAELYRRKGELTLQQMSDVSTQSSITNSQPLVPSIQEAEACFLKAIAIARQQQAKLWELRAIMSLSRLWQQQSKRQEAHSMLSEVYGWFTEGFDTKDLQEAKALIEELK